MEKIKIQIPIYKRWFINTKQYITDKKNRPGILVLLFALLFSIYGELRSLYIKKMGIYTVAVIKNVSHASKGGFIAEFEYSYLNTAYKQKGSFSETNINLESAGKRMIIVFLPHDPSMCVVVEYPPDCIGDAPPEGWTEIPKCE